MTRFLVLCVAMVTFLAPPEALAKQKSKKKKPRILIDMVADLSFTYDDNVFRYSDDEIDAIKNLPQVDQYATVETTDDLLMAQSLSFEASMGSSRFTVGIKQNSNYRNTMKGYFNYSLGIRQKLGSYFYGYLTYRYTPRYYIRQIYDVDTMDYEEYDYAKHYVSLEARKGLLQRGRLGLKGHLHYEREKYPDYFQEYDFHGFATEGEVKYAFTNRLTMGIVGEYRRISTKGFDEAWETKETSDETDGSYHENTFELFASYDLPLRVAGSRPTLGLAGTYNTKAYTTERSSLDDPYHAGREDSKVSMETELDFAIGRGINGELSYKWQQREVDSFAKDDLGEEKDFTANTIGVSISLTRDLIG